MALAPWWAVLEAQNLNIPLSALGACSREVPAAQEFNNFLRNSSVAQSLGCARSLNLTNCVGKASPGAYQAARGIYLRLKHLELWRHVDDLVALRTVGSKGGTFTSLHYGKLAAAVFSNPFLCRDNGLGALLHGGQTCFRELSRFDSLHLCLWQDERFDIHIDEIRPVKGRNDKGICLYEQPNAFIHIGREVLPLAIPGLIAYPSPIPFVEDPEPQRGSEALRWHLRF